MIRFRHVLRDTDIFLKIGTFLRVYETGVRRICTKSLACIGVEIESDYGIWLQQYNLYKRGGGGGA